MFLSEYAPLEYLINQDEPGVLSIIVDRSGPGYRNIGAMMAFSQSGEKIGSLSSGCIEDDLWLTAKKALKTNVPIISHYGGESKIMDLKLPCGGDMHILSLPNPDLIILRDIMSRLAGRKKTGISIDVSSGKISLSKPIQQSLNNETFSFNLTPELKLIVMGTGSETEAFCSLSIAANIEIKLLTPDLSLINHKLNSITDSYHLKSVNDIPNLSIDSWTAIVLFFHDHDWEPALIKSVLNSDAFFIGAQGSKTAHRNLVEKLTELGCSKTHLSKLQPQIGLIPSARDPKTLAISVLADIVKYSNLNN